MVIQKFGGTSVGTPEGINKVIEIVTKSKKGVGGVVVSAFRANLALAQLYESQDNLDRALAAARRKPYFGGWWLLSSFLREEGRLAALTGDRAELAKLVGEPGSQ